MASLLDNSINKAYEDFKERFVNEMIKDCKENLESIEESYYLSELKFDDALGFTVFLNKHYAGELAAIIGNTVERLNEAYENADNEEVEEVTLFQYRDIVLDVLYMHAYKVLEIK